MTKAPRDRTPAEPAETAEPLTISGTAVKGVMHNGIVQAYRIGPDNTTGRPTLRTPIGEPVRTNRVGEFTLPIPRDLDKQWVVLEVRADEKTRMTCDATAGCQDARDRSRVEFGEQITLSDDFVLRSAVRAESGAESHVTPLSHIAVAQARQSDQGLTDPGLRTAYRETSRFYGLDRDVLLNTRPKDITKRSNPNGAERDRTRLSLINAAFMQKVSEDDSASALTELLDQASGGTEQGTVTAAGSTTRNKLVLDLAEHAADLANDLRTRNDSLPSRTEFSRAENWAVDLFEQASPEIPSAPENDGRQRTGEENEDQGNNNNPAPQGENADESNTGDDTNTGDDDATEPDDSAYLSWVAPGHRVNGEEIEMSELDGYTIQYGQDADNLSQKVEIPLADTMEYEIDGLAEGEWHFRIRSYDEQGNASAWSDTASKTIAL